MNEGKLLKFMKEIDFQTLLRLNIAGSYVPPFNIPEFWQGVIARYQVRKTKKQMERIQRRIKYMERK